jgi:1-acyl-sn-glycerol-3-phosphate acyltransferase
MKSITYTDGLYRTPPGRAGFFSRRLPTLFFYPRFIYTTVKASFLVAIGKYSNWYWEVSGLETLHAIERAGATVEIEGIANLRSFEGPCVFIANHMSTLETYTLPGILLPFRDITYVMKKSLVTYPVFGRIMRWMRPITVTRTNPREDLKAVLEEGSALLKEGRSVVIFPQTTRTMELEPERFNSIGVKLARRAGVPVVPIALRTDALGNGRVLKDFGTVDPTRDVHFSIGEPMEITGRGNEEHRRIIEFITGKLNTWKAADA